MGLRIEKKGLRALGIAESFSKAKADKSTLVGLVMRSDLIVDGLAITSTKLEGYDSTQAIIQLYNSLNRNDINLTMLDGAVISLYNIVDIEEVYQRTKRPLIVITFKPSKGLQEVIKKHFFTDYEERLKLYNKLGDRVEVTLKTKYKVYVRALGIDDESMLKRILDKFTLQGSLPEPLRVAKLIARACFKYKFQ